MKNKRGLEKEFFFFFLSGSEFKLNIALTHLPDNFYWHVFSWSLYLKTVFCSYPVKYDVDQPDSHLPEPQIFQAVGSWQVTLFLMIAYHGLITTATWWNLTSACKMVDRDPLHSTHNLLQIIRIASLALRMFWERFYCFQVRVVFKPTRKINEKLFYYLQTCSSTAIDSILVLVLFLFR